MTCVRNTRAGPGSFERGGTHGLDRPRSRLPFERVAPATTRLVVVDVQNDFAADGGWFDRSGQDLSLMRRAIDDLVQFIPIARAAGVRPIFVQAIYDEKWLSRPMLERHQLVGFDTRHCQSGTWGAEFYKVAPEEGDDVIVKHRYSAFIGTELDPLLRAQGVENLVFTGITSNVCVESTARDAYMHDYHVLVVVGSDRHVRLGAARGDPRQHPAGVRPGGHLERDRRRVAGGGPRCRSELSAPGWPSIAPVRGELGIDG